MSKNGTGATTTSLMKPEATLRTILVPIGRSCACDGTGISTRVDVDIIFVRESSPPTVIALLLEAEESTLAGTSNKNRTGLDYGVPIEYSVCYMLAFPLSLSRGLLAETPKVACSDIAKESTRSPR